MGLPEMPYFIFGYFSTKLGISVDGHEKIIIWSISLKEPILSNIWITADVQNMHEGLFSCTLWTKSSS
jgi:hypothetical protein